jgi:hypothetical protein
MSVPRAPRRRLAAVAGGAVAALALGGGALWAQGPPPRVPTNAQGTPIPPPGARQVGTPVPEGASKRPRGETPMSPEVMAKAEAQARANRAAAVPEREHTRGKKVRFGDKDVQLPPDAYLDGGGQGLGQRVSDGKWVSVRSTIVRRGNASASVDERPGKVLHVEEDPARPGQMNFLVEALK